MHAIEFEADAKDRTIEIPEQYKEFSNKHLRIIVMMEERTQPAGRRMPGSAKDALKVSDDFEKPLSWEEVKSIHGE